jgi:signal transduction histidine kinase
MYNNCEWPQFFDRLVHDLREPLRSIYSFSELLRELSRDRLGNEGDQAAQEIIAAAANMRVLIDGISRFGSTLNAEPSAGEASLQLAFDMATLTFERELTACGGVLVGERLPRVGVDLEWLNFLLENLIGNSLRFRGKSNPEILVTAQPGTDAESEFLEVRVIDNGIGIPAHELEAVFRPFARLHGRKYPGAGLGLTACRNVVEAHGGRIWMQSNNQEGCTCVFTIPEARPV